MVTRLANWKIVCVATVVVTGAYGWWKTADIEGRVAPITGALSQPADTRLQIPSFETRDGPPVLWGPVFVLPDPIPLSQGEREELCQKLAVPDGANLSAGVLHHALNAYQRGVSIPRFKLKTAAEIVDVLTDSQRSEELFGKSAVEKTRYGVRFPTQPTWKRPSDLSLESHRDHGLATLASAGIPLSTPVRVGEETFSIRDVLADSVAYFSLEQRELAWTAITYCAYLRPQSKWRNRFGDVFDLNTLTSELLSRSLEKDSCYGLHILNGLCFILRTHDEVSPMISDEVRESVRQKLMQALAATVNSQTRDGGWNSRCLDELRTTPWPAFTAPGALDANLLATSHILEWMLYLPSDMRPPDDTVLRGAEFLKKTLGSISEQERLKGYCPVTHSVSVLLVLSSPKG